MKKAISVAKMEIKITAGIDVLVDKFLLLFNKIKHPKFNNAGDNNIPQRKKTS